MPLSTMMGSPMGLMLRLLYRLHRSIFGRQTAYSNPLGSSPRDFLSPWYKPVRTMAIQTTGVSKVKSVNFCLEIKTSLATFSKV